MDFRHEWKHEITAADLLVLRSRLRAVMQPDAHGIDGRYTVRSLYFDDGDDTALREKLDGVSQREKFRIRFYDGDTGVIHLEKKSKLGGLGSKQSERLSPGEARDIAEGRTEWMVGCGRALVEELEGKMRTRGLRPRTVVDYTREAFTFAPGNVRVTLDYGIRTGIHCTDFLNPACITVPASEAIILEVKWDAYLPDIIRDIIQLEGRHTAPFSKYAACRIYG